MRTLQVDRQTRDHAVDPFSVGGSDFYRLRGVEFVENGRQTELGQALYAQIAVGGNFADDETRFIDGSDDEAVRGAAAHRNDHVSHVVGDWMKIDETLAYYFAYFGLVARDARRIHERR